MKTKSKLVLGLSILSAATLAAGATSTFAWYSVAGTAKNTDLAQAHSVGVADSGVYGEGGILFKVEKVTTDGKSTTGELLITNTAGRSYWRSGNAYGEIAGDASDPFADRQGKVTYKVSIVNASDGTSAPAANILAAAVGTYTVRATISGYGKMSMVKTAVLGDVTTANTPGDDAQASGALGVAYDHEHGVMVPFMQITISDAGEVTYKKYTTAGVLDANATSWGTVNSAVECNPLWYGIAEQGGAAENHGDSSFADKYNCSVTLSVNDGTSDLTAPAHQSEEP